MWCLSVKEFSAPAMCPSSRSTGVHAHLNKLLDLGIVGSFNHGRGEQLLDKLFNGNGRPLPAILLAQRL